tara:strand:+ start:1219 stop:1374 length:156 start_codon:yes stop_codon:yes gene_type:complete
MVSPVGYTHRAIPALTLMMLMERRSDGTSGIIAPKMGKKKFFQRRKFLFGG